MPNGRSVSRAAVLIAAVLIAFGGETRGGDPRPGEPLKRQGDEIVACGQFFHTTAPVVTWMDPGGYDAYRTERRFVPIAEASWDRTRAAGEIESPGRFGLRRAGLTPEQVEAVRGGGWDLPTLRGVVDQFVLHYDVCGTSRRCFDVLHDHRGLSVHFLLDVDGTIYQTLDLKERAWHATKANDRSIGIEIANIGAYPKAEVGILSNWYAAIPGGTKLTLPASEIPFLRRKDATLKTIRRDPVVGEIQKQSLTQYDLTPEQYDSLTKLTAALCTVFPKIRCDYPRDASGKLVPGVLSDADYTAFRGILGHFHVQSNKTDPGPALQWDRLIDGAKKLMARP